MSEAPVLVMLHAQPSRRGADVAVRWVPFLPALQLVPRLAADPQALDLLSRMLAPNPRHRVSAARALAHPWFDDIRAAEAAALQAGVAAEAARQARAGAVATAPLPHRGC